jgi:hypothetical protein
MKKERRIIVLKVLARWWREFSFYTVAGIWVFFIPDLHDPRWSVKSGFEGTYFHRRFLRIAQDRLPAEILQVDIYLFSGTHCENKCFSQLWNVACFFFFFNLFFKTWLWFKIFCLFIMTIKFMCYIFRLFNQVVPMPCLGLDRKAKIGKLIR